MKAGRLEVVGADGQRASRFTQPIGEVLFREGLSVGEVDLDYFRIRNIIGPARGGYTVRVLGAPQPPPVPAPDPAPTPPPAEPEPDPIVKSSRVASQMQRMRAAKAAKAAARSSNA